MIENIGDYRDPEFQLLCESCGEIAPETFDTFNEMLEWKMNYGKKEGWGSIKKDGVWEDRCPKCNPFNKDREEPEYPRKTIKRRAV